MVYLFMHEPPTVLGYPLRPCPQVEVYRLSSDFDAATRIVLRAMPPLEGLAAGSVLVRRVFAGVNASDINYTAGRCAGVQACRAWSGRRWDCASATPLQMPAAACQAASSAPHIPPPSLARAAWGWSMRCSMRKSMAGHNTRRMLTPRPAQVIEISTLYTQRVLRA